MRVSKDWYKEQWVDIFQIDLLSPSGLSWRVSRGTNVKAGAPWSEDNKARSKAFPVSIFGSSAQSLAEQYRLEQLERLNLLNHNYSSRHIDYSKREVI